MALSSAFTEQNMALACAVSSSCEIYEEVCFFYQMVSGYRSLYKRILSLSYPESAVFHFLGSAGIWLLLSDSD
jgi:hypothetical protein